MANEKRLIDANALLEDFGEEPMVWSDTEAEIQERNDWLRYKNIVEGQPTVDAVEVDVLKAWLYEIAMNNSDNYLGDACEVLIGRLDGLREFARERRNDEV